MEKASTSYFFKQFGTEMNELMIIAMPWKLKQIIATDFEMV